MGYFEGTDVVNGQYRRKGKGHRPIIGGVPDGADCTSLGGNASRRQTGGAAATLDHVRCLAPSPVAGPRSLFHIAPMHKPLRLQTLARIRRFQ